MKRVMIVLSVLAIVALVASAEKATASGAGQIDMTTGYSTSPTATANGSLWINTGSGASLIVDYLTTYGDPNTHSSDINFEVLGGLTPGNLQLLTAYQHTPAQTSIWLLSIPNPDYVDVPNSAEWDMNQGGPNGNFQDPTQLNDYYLAGSSGTAYFRIMAWTGLYNDYPDAYNASLAGQGVYVADTGVIQGWTYTGGIDPIPSIGNFMPAMILQKAVATPEPSTLLLAATGLLGVLAYAWRKLRK